MASLYPPAPAPPTKLGIYRQLSTNAGVHVSPLILRAMSIGDKWGDVLGSMNKESSMKLLHAYFDAGGNFIDTANNYQDETSELFIGEWAAKRGIRDQIFIATKALTNLISVRYKRGDNTIAQKTHYTGNSVKSMHISAVASLKKLQTDYIDPLYVHWWDWETSIEEIMRGLHALVMAGKVLYLGISDTPTWVVTKANQYARDHALTPFSVYQGAWNVLERDFERDIIPMARSEGIALAPWNVLAGGKLRTDAEEDARRAVGEGGRKTFGERTDKERKMSAALEKVAKEVGAKHVTAVAIAYIMHKAPHVFPIVGGRKVEHLLGNLGALDINLTKDQIVYLESVVEFDIGFPSNFVGVGDDQPALKHSAANYAPPLRIQPHKAI